MIVSEWVPGEQCANLHSVILFLFLWNTAAVNERVLLLCVCLTLCVKGGHRDRDRETSGVRERERERERDSESTVR